MEAIASTVVQINQKIERLMQAHNSERESKNRLADENQQLLTQIETFKNQIKQQQEKHKIVKLAKSLSVVNESSDDVKLKINELVREVDRCIALLNR